MFSRGIEKAVKGGIEAPGCNGLMSIIKNLFDTNIMQL